MDWILDNLSALYLWASNSPIFIQVALGVFLGLFSMTLVGLMMGPRINAVDMARTLTVLENQLDSIYFQVYQINQSTEEIEHLRHNSDDILTALQGIDIEVSNIEAGVNPKIPDDI
ncbi:hypothetical protein [Alcanivorax sp.]|uniref:hypothetical protein n=1 Tax=Alcanivorax sp. TaxID=1872427 RepID=UPI0019A841AA|nr:hypothetical protein [Alcanivorax sp.]MBD3643539.1 hypothetical protein [Alcanivorax sp.]